MRPWTRVSHMHPPSRITASIVTFRSGPVIAACLESLFASTRRSLDVVVFDNASDDDTVARLKPFAGRVRIVAHPVNLGFGQGNNRALSDAAGDYFLLLNPDIELPPGGNWDFVIVDPPRAGLGERVAKSLAALSIPKIAYVSCDPATLSRDLVTLLAAGYRVEEAHLVDLFPQTYHIESLAVLRLR